MTALSDRLLWLGAATLLGVAAIGYVTGTRGSSRTLAAPRASATPRPASSDSVPRYSTIGTRRRGPNAGMYDDAFVALGNEVPRPKQPSAYDQATFDEALRARATRRAYAGAPPTIPHAIQQRDAPACLACHQSGALIDGRIAPAMSHPRYDSCAQCHVVEADARGLAGAKPLTENGFEGAESPGAGARAWPGAPPTMPHSQHMRDSCSSCHGPTGKPGLRTSHPERQNCRQCHAPSALLDQRGPGQPPEVFEP